MADIKEKVICPWCKEEMRPYPHQGYYWFQCECGARTPTLWHATEEQTRKRALSYTADVVPKSEVDNLKELLEMNDKAYNKLREIYHTDTEALVLARQKSEVESTAHKCEDCAGCTQWKCDCSLIEEHAKTEVARKIFEEIGRVVCHEYNMAQVNAYNYHIYGDNDAMVGWEKVSYLQGIKRIINLLEDIKKKYTEEE